MEDEKLSFDLDCSFSSTASTSSFLTSTPTTSTTSSARSSLSLSLSSSVISPRPHSSASPSSLWPAIRAASTLSSDGLLHLRHLRLLRHLGSGHLARVFHCRLKGSDSFDFALKVIDLNSITSTASHVRTEAQVLSSLDHPFLPTLYARMDASHYSCFLIDYCPGGDLHSLLARHPSHRLPLSAVKFFAAEVLLALEYLHALGFVYRDLKPENVLIRGDGHIMLSDFDLCFSSETGTTTAPSLHRRRVRRRQRQRGIFGHCYSSRKENEEEEIVQVVAEPVSAFSRACVGTHEYLAPEIVSGNGHGCGVDWWAFGVFVYELLYGRTPFKGASKDATLKNVMRKELRFPDEDEESSSSSSRRRENAMARDLVRRLLVRDVKGRLGSERGAAEIKAHPFFEGVRWQMIRGEKPPVVVGPAGAVVVKGAERRRGGWWSRVVKRGIFKLGLSRGSSNNNNKGRKIINKSVIKEKRRN